jgi:hypothetical protein
MLRALYSLKFSFDAWWYDKILAKRVILGQELTENYLKTTLENIDQLPLVPSGGDSGPRGPARNENFLSWHPGPYLCHTIENY